MVSKENTPKPREYKYFRDCNGNPSNMLNAVRIQTLSVETLLLRASDILEGSANPHPEDICNASSLVFEALVIIGHVRQDAYTAVQELDA